MCNMSLSEVFQSLFKHNVHVTLLLEGCVMDDFLWISNVYQSNPADYLCVGNPNVTAFLSFFCQWSMIGL